MAKELESAIDEIARNSRSGCIRTDLNQSDQMINSQASALVPKPEIVFVVNKK